VSERFLLAELTRAGVADLAPRSILVLPFGAVEQHGPHLPFGTDALIVDAVSRRAVDEAVTDSPLVLAPTVPYGSSDHHLAVGGALSLSSRSFEECAADLLRSAGTTGFRRVFAVNGHGGNEQQLRIAGHVAAGSRPLAVGGASYWQLAQEELALATRGTAPIPGHAGQFETSLLLALRPDLVHHPPARDGWDDVAGSRFWHVGDRSWSRIDGFTDSPADATALEGEKSLTLVAARVAESLAEFDRLAPTAPC
jgi:creatinine amidohydrolase